MLNSDTLNEFINDYSDNLLKYDSFEVNLTLLARYFNDDLVLTGTYKLGFDVHHGQCLYFTQIVDGYEVCITVWDWEEVEFGIRAISGKVAIKLSSLETMLLVFKIEQAKKTMIKASVVLVVLIALNILLIPLLSTFNKLFASFKIYLLIIMIISAISCISFIVHNHLVIKKIKPWLIHNDLLN